MSCNGTLNFNVKFFFTGVDSKSTTLEMSLSTAWRDRQSGAEQLAGEEIAAFFAQVQESGDRIFVQPSGSLFRYLGSYRDLFYHLGPYFY